MAVSELHRACSDLDDRLHLTTCAGASSQIWRAIGFVPEGFNLAEGRVQPGQAGHPLRPELAESAYYLYGATGDPAYLAIGRDMVASLQRFARVGCGFAAVRDVSTRELSDRMDSFFLAETTKYLYLLFAPDPPEWRTRLERRARSGAGAWRRGREGTRVSVWSGSGR